MPDELRRLLESGRPADLDNSHPYLRERVVANRRTSPGVILTLAAPGKGQSGFVSKAGRRCWIFGTAALSRRSLKAGELAELQVTLTVRLEPATGPALKGIPLLA